MATNETIYEKIRINWEIIIRNILIILLTCYVMLCYVSYVKMTVIWYLSIIDSENDNF